MRILQKAATAGALAALCCLSIPQLKADDLAEKFANPPANAGPQTWWHWMNGNITKEGITADLESMKRVGIHGAEIFNVYEGIPAGPAPFMSPQWLDLFKHAAAEADRLGMELCFHNCAGWSSSGGPWITPDHAMQTVVMSETKVKGGASVSVNLPQPKMQANYYRDIAVLAFPTPSNNKRFDKIDLKCGYGFGLQYGMEPETAAAPAGAAITRSSIIDLTSKMDSTGKLTWDAPAGDWTVLRIGHTPTGKENHPAPDAGRGLECDKLSREAMDAHWAGGIDPILKKLGPLAGKSLNDCLIDSYEVGWDNWTPLFREEFKKRRGYDPLPYLPTLTGRYIDNTETTERFLWDFRRTIADLFAENYYMYFSELCKKHGLMSSMEPYDGPYEGLEVGAKADILMGEFWAGSDGAPSCVKLAASVAHTHGIKIVGAESFTAAPNNGKWQNHPGRLKTLGDRIWCTGVNRFIFHCYAHQPWVGTNKIPGMTMGQWGTHFGRYNTWWEQSRAWIAYITRAQYLLQSGKNVADVLYFGGEEAPNDGPYRPELKEKGYDYDAVGTDLIYALSVKDGKVVTPIGTSYRLLVFPKTTWMTPALARKVGELVHAGATVCAPKPVKSPSLNDYPACDSEVAKLADEIWGTTPGEHTYGKGRIIPSGAEDKILASMDVVPDCASATEGADITFIHRKIGKANVYFVSNQRERQQTLDCTFRVSGFQPELWDAETGKTSPAPIWHSQNGTTTVNLNLEQAGSIFVVFRSPATGRSADPIVKMDFEVNNPILTKLPKLEIRRAVYGVFTFDKMVDVTPKLQAAVKDDHIEILADNQLAGDPASMIHKEMRVQYTCGDKDYNITVPEHSKLILPRTGESGKLQIVRAMYGKFAEGTTELPVIKFIDITDRLAAKIRGGLLAVRVNNDLAGSDPSQMVVKTLRVDYAVDGTEQNIEVPENSELRLPESAWNLLPPTPQLTVENKKLNLIASEAGRYTFTHASGKTKSLSIASIQKPIEVSGAWKVSFQPHRGAPAEATFDSLISWPKHEIPGIKYFSGTATYHKKINIPASYLGDNKFLQLDLGRVDVIAEVRLNGKDLGILWEAPFRVNITGAAKEGDNELEVRITNLWPNRMIGDEQYPDDCEWNGNGPTLKKWPDWVLKGEPRPSKDRLTFTTWKHWHKDSKLLPSGLLGPVVIRSIVKQAVD